MKFTYLLDGGGSLYPYLKYFNSFIQRELHNFIQVLTMVWTHFSLGTASLGQSLYSGTHRK